MRYGRTTIAAVDVALPDGTAQRADRGNRGARFSDRRDGRLRSPPAKAIPTGRSRSTMEASVSAGSLPARHRNISGPAASASRATAPAIQALSSSSGNTSSDWSRLNARWWSATCHRSLYGYQVRAALAIAIENPHSAVTFLPLACSGSTIDLGFFNPLRARECPPTGACAANAVPQMVRLKEALELARKTDKERKLDRDPAYHRRERHLVRRSGRQRHHRALATERTLFKRAA